MAVVSSDVGVLAFRKKSSVSPGVMVSSRARLRGDEERMRRATRRHRHGVGPDPMFFAVDVHEDLALEHAGVMYWSSGAPCRSARADADGDLLTRG
jgi:hypothetical protein